MIGPIGIWPTWHIRYPKIDLEGRHFGVYILFAARPVRLITVLNMSSSSQTVTDERFASFLAKCQAFGDTGCYVASGRRKSKRGCFAHTNRAMIGGRKRTHLDTLLLILRACVDTGFTHVNSNSNCPENTSLGFAECEEATRKVPSVARSRAFRRRRQLLFQLVVPVKK